MNKFCTLLICSFSICFRLPAQYVAVTNLNPVKVSEDTGEKPQAKVWQHAGKHWAVLATSAGTKIFRLDGVTWTDVLTIARSSNPKCDVKVVGNVTHILLLRGAGNSYLVSVEYDPALSRYKAWSTRPSAETIVFEEGTEAATLELDGRSRMWIASTGTNDVYVRWSDAPYSSWSAPITIASGILDDDICAIRTLGNRKIGVLWSNQSSQRFGFRTHADGAAPTDWSKDEVPASKSAVNKIGGGFADDHLNMTLASDGTLYCAVKTSYDTKGYPKLVLLVRRPGGTWDNLYQVSSYEDGGTRPIVILNEALGKLKVVYTSRENGGDILYRESLIASIAFGSPITLSKGKYNDVTSTRETYHSDIVILATKINSSKMQAVGFLGTDGTMHPALSVPAPDSLMLQQQLEVYPNPVSQQANIRFALSVDGEYSLRLYDAKGAQISLLRQGTARAGYLQTVAIYATHLKPGIYMVSLQTSHNIKTRRLLLI